MNAHLKGFAALFDGSDSLFARCSVRDEEPDKKGKRKADYKELPRAPADDDWDGHGKGEFGLTITPQKSDGTCKFLVIDIDVYSGLDHAALIKAVGGKLAVGNSKSDGAHLFGFLQEPVPEDKLEAVGRRIMLGLGFSDEETAPEGTAAEVFPRKPKPGKKPRGINVPYSGWDTGECDQVIFKLMVPPSGKGEILVHMSLPEFVLRYGGERRITFDDLEALAVALESQAPKQKARPQTDDLPTKEEAEWWLNLWADKIRKSVGRRADKTLNTAAYSMGHWAGYIDKEVVERRLREAWIFRKPEDTNYDDFAKVWPHAFDEGEATKKSPYRRKPQDQGTLDIVWGNEVEMEDIDWLWYGKLAHGMLTLISGNPGLQKSQVALHVGARVSTGGDLPLGQGTARKGRVLVMSAEDAPKNAIMPRWVAAGGDPNMLAMVKGIVTMEGERRVLNLSQNVPLLERLLDESPYDFGLIIIDPISAYMGPPRSGKGDSHTNTDVRNFLYPLNELAEKHHVAILCVSHPPKTATSAINYSSGSLAWVAGPRVFLVCGKEYAMVDDADGNEKKEPTGRRLMAVGKSNYAPDGAEQTIAYTVDTRPVTMKDGTVVEREMVVFLETVPYTADEVVAGTAGVTGKVTGGGAPNREMQARKFILRMLKNAPHTQTWASEIEGEAERAGIAEKTLQRAKTKLKNEDRLFDGKQPNVVDGPWVWALDHEVQWELMLNPPI